MKILSKGMACLLASSLLVACATSGQGPSKQDIGTVTGGVAGGLVGSQFGGGRGQLVAVGVGTLLGAYIGNQIGRSMDDVDRLKMQSALNNNRTGQTSAWTNQRTGDQYSVQPTQTYWVSPDSGQQVAPPTYQQGVPSSNATPCREFTSTANIGGQSQQIYGTACRQPDGSWKVINQ